MCVCVLGSSGKSPFLCGAGGSFWGWAAGGPADMLSRSSSTTRPYYCSGPHSLCPLQSANYPPPPSLTSPPSSPVFRLAGAADLWPREGGSRGQETIAGLSSIFIYQFFVLYLHLTAYFGGVDISSSNFITIPCWKTPLVSMQTCSASLMANRVMGSPL